MAGGTERLDDYLDDALKATFVDARERLNILRKELLLRGFWVDAKYKITSITDLDDSHISSIIRMLKNKSINQSKYWKGLKDKPWQALILEHPAYEHLRTEAIARNLPGAALLPEVGDAQA